LVETEDSQSAMIWTDGSTCDVGGRSHAVQRMCINNALTCNWFFNSSDQYKINNRRKL